jgi:hypothetical protein
VTGVRWTFGPLRVGTVLGREPNGDRPAPLALAGAFFRPRPLHRSRRWGSGDHWPYKNAVVRVNFRATRKKLTNSMVKAITCVNT